MKSASSDSPTSTPASSSTSPEATMLPMTPSQQAPASSMPLPVFTSTTCPTCGSVSDFLVTFLAAYGPAGVILIDGQEAPAHENGPFGTLRRRHPRLIHALRTASGEGRKRATTVHDGRVLRWTITHQPSPDGLVNRVIVLAQDNGDESTSPPSNLGDSEDGRSSNGTVRRQGPSMRGTPDAASTSTFPSPPPLDYLNAAPSSYRVEDTSPSILRAPAPNQAWMADPRCAALISGGGEIGDIVRSMDWAHTPFGPVETWSTSLIMMLGVMLHVGNHV
jgi:hypothetical protein